MKGKHSFRGRRTLYSNVYYAIPVALGGCHITELVPIPIRDCLSFREELTIYNCTLFKSNCIIIYLALRPEVIHVYNPIIWEYKDA